MPKGTFKQYLLYEMFTHKKAGFPQTNEESPLFFVYRIKSRFSVKRRNPNPSPTWKIKFGFLSFGPSDWIRTSGLLNPIQARYQTSPHPDISYLVASLSMIAHFPQTCKPFFHFSGKFLPVVRGPPFPPEEAAGQPAKPPRASGIRRMTRGGSLAVSQRVFPPGFRRRVRHLRLGKGKITWRTRPPWSPGSRGP